MYLRTNKNGQFPIGFWNYAAVTSPIGCDVDEWADLGANYTMTPSYSGDPSQRERMLTMLDRCKELKITVILRDTRIMSPSGDIRESVREAVNDLGLHPSVGGYMITDEPGADALPYIREATKACLEFAPDRMPLTNFGPWCPVNYSESGILGRPSVYLSDVLADIARESSMPLLCYDCYAQLKPGERGFDMYFHNLEIFRKASVAAGIPYWTTLLCREHYDYQEPTRNDFRWQINTAAAHGAAGLLWFTVYNGRNTATPIDTRGRHTPTYLYMSEILDDFKNGLGTVLPHLTLEGVWHVHRTFGGTAIYEDGVDPERRLYAINLPEDRAAIFSRFTGDDGATYYAVTNNSRSEGVYIEVMLRTVDFEYDAVFSDKSSRRLTHDEGVRAINGGDWFMPGEMRMWRVVPKN